MHQTSNCVVLKPIPMLDWFFRGDLAVSESSQRADAAEYAVLRSQLTQVAEQLEQTQLQLSEEQGRVAALREQLATLEEDSSSDGARYRAQISELSKALQVGGGVSGDLGRGRWKKGD